MGLWVHNITSKQALAAGSKMSRYAVKINRRTLVEFDHRKGGGAAAVFRAAANALDRIGNTMKHDGDHDQDGSRVWLLWFFDRSVENEVFEGEGAEEAAKKRFDLCRQNWNCVLLQEFERG